MGFGGEGWAALLAVGVAWMVGTFGGGAALAWLWKRLHPRLSFYKLWAFWSMMLGGAVALLFAFGAF